MNEPRHEAIDPASPERRRFLVLVIGVLASLNALIMGIPFVRSLFGAARKRKAKWSKVGEVNSLPENGPVELKFRLLTEDAYHYEEALYSVWVIKYATDKVTVFSPICPHLGCHFIWDPKISRFACPCHASVYSIDGKVLYGPAPRSLDTLPAKIENGTLYVQWERFKPSTPEKIAV